MTSLSTRRTEVETGPGSSGISTVRSGEMYYWYLQWSEWVVCDSGDDTGRDR